ncbi:Gp138 family membrane-puncturing spike protein [Chromobacterium haemolyticum]|uniref:Gp138 family membrane-puncturing spike protein n=1 Tax=Chromobacterium haemolyticum TaxID=394935 RepID=UPI000594199E|nr:Gp138 family membrane-puncturing spike protein [Chromobacterium haemolyticum]
MAITVQELVDDPQATQRVILSSHQAGIWTAIPGIVKSFNPVAMTCQVQPAIQGIMTQPNGKNVATNLPLLVDVPVVFQSGGGCITTYPISANDECLVVFSSRCIDAWWQSGGVQIPMEMRMHDLSDGFALVGPRSQPNKISGYSTSSMQLRSLDGSTYIDINPTTQKVKIVAPGGLEVTAPTSTFSGTVTVSGLFTFLAGLVGSASSGAAAVISGIVNFTGSILSNGKAIDSTHTHSGVQPGGGNTGSPN